MATKKDAAFLEAEIRKELKSLANAAKRRLAQPTSTWRHDVPFTIDGPRYSGNDLTAKVTTEDAAYFFLDGGTSVRHAVMKKPFVRKTNPRNFNSGAGVGGDVAIVSKNIALPGIEEREWTTLTAQEYGAIVQSAIDKILAGYKGRPTTGTRRISHSDWVYEEDAD